MVSSQLQTVGVELDFVGSEALSTLPTCRAWQVMLSVQEQYLRQLCPSLSFSCDKWYEEGTRVRTWSGGDTSEGFVALLPTDLLTGCSPAGRFGKYTGAPVETSQSTLSPRQRRRPFVSRGELERVGDCLNCPFFHPSVRQSVSSFVHQSVLCARIDPSRHFFLDEDHIKD